MDAQNDKLPSEYPLKDSLTIYGKRLVIFLSVVLFNFALLGLLLGVSRISKGNSSPTLILWALAVFVLFAFSWKPLHKIAFEHITKLENNIVLSPVLSTIFVIVGIGLVINLILFISR